MREFTGKPCNEGFDERTLERLKPRRVNRPIVNGETPADCGEPAWSRGINL
jgi:hypothetical protein